MISTSSDVLRVVVDLSHAFYQPFTTNARVTVPSRTFQRGRKFHSSDLLINSIDYIEIKKINAHRTSGAGHARAVQTQDLAARRDGRDCSRICRARSVRDAVSCS